MNYAHQIIKKLLKKSIKKLIFTLFCTLFGLSLMAQTSANISELSADGAWCWFSDPRAVYYEGQYKRTYIGWITSTGDVMIGYYDHVTKEIKTKVIHSKLQIDDHDCPSILFKTDGRIMVFYSKHTESYPIQLVVSKNPEDISEWEANMPLNLNDTQKYPAYSNVYTYTVPHNLSDENKTYLFWRGLNSRPSYSKSADGGKTWQKGKIVISNSSTSLSNPQYTKICSNNKDKIHIAFTNGHPRNEANNNIYYICYQNGTFYKANGEKIATEDELPIFPEKSHLVYNAATLNQRAWVWDIAEDENGYPVIAYVRFKDIYNHIYCYAKWDGSSWISIEMVNSGKWFPQTPTGTVEVEPNYSGGLILDHENTNIVYLSRQINGKFEIEKWTLNASNSFDIETITSNSQYDNVRPFAVMNATANNPLQVVWMENIKYISALNYLCKIKGNFVEVAKVLVSNITISSQNNATIVRAGEQLQFTAQVLPSNATDASITWSVIAKNGNASINQNGVLTATSEGVVVVKATANDNSGVSSEWEITIQSPSTEILLYPKSENNLLGVKVMINDAETYSLDLIDITGRIVYSRKDLSPLVEDEIDLTNFRSGVYIVRLASSKKQIIKKIVL